VVGYPVRPHHGNNGPGTAPLAGRCRGVPRRFLAPYVSKLFPNHPPDSREIGDGKIFVFVDPMKMIYVGRFRLLLPKLYKEVKCRLLFRHTFAMKAADC
jgi:hypothetical protein